MDDFTWSSGDIDKDLIAQVNDPDFWQKVKISSSIFLKSFMSTLVYLEYEGLF